MRKVEKRERTVKEEITILVCDICDQEIPPTQISMSEPNGYKRSAFWWKYPIDWIVSIKKGSTAAEQYEFADYDVHVMCAFKAIQKAVEEASNDS